MSFPRYVFGSTTIARLSSPDELRQLLDDPLLHRETIIIKPNWVSTKPGDFTDADTLRALFEALDSRFVITESCCLARSMNILDEGLGFTIGGKEVNWKWLLKGDGWKWLIENPDWSWFKSGEHWDQLIKEDEAFLDKYGFSELFHEFKVTYINVTEEVWNGRIANPAEVKRIVESKYEPVQNEKLYRMVPARLFELRNSTFISYEPVAQTSAFALKQGSL